MYFVWMSRLLGLMVWLPLGGGSSQISDLVAPGQVCQTNAFNAACAADEVIVMESALYGRMRLGDCVLTDYGHVGCHANVMVQTDRKCSGRHECKIGIPDAEFDKTQPCPLEFKTYFEAVYRCYKVVTPILSNCENKYERTLTGPVGYVSNAVTESSGGWGGVSCPWVVTLLPGQRVNVTLYDFARPTWDKTDEGICYQYALITERGVSTRNTRICGGDTRIKHVYMSRGNVLEMRILTRGTDDVNTFFMFKYEAIGCPMLSAPKYGWVSQTEHVAVLGCNYTETTWKLHCEGNTWTGTKHNCTMAPSGDKEGVVLWGNIALPYGVSIGIISGLAVIIGVIILLVGLICLEWRKMKHAPKDELAGESQTTGALYKDSQYNKSIGRNSLVGGGQPSGPMRDNEYAYGREGGWAAQPYVGPHGGYGPGPTQSSPSTFTYGQSTTHTSSLTPDSPSDTEHHIYESPTTVRREVQNITSPPQYFELDPSAGSKTRYQGDYPPGGFGEDSPTGPDGFSQQTREILGGPYVH